MLDMLGMSLLDLVSPKNSDRHLIRFSVLQDLVKRHEDSLGDDALTFWKWASTLPGIPFATVCKTANVYPWNFAAVSSRPDVDIELVIQYATLFQDHWSELSRHTPFEMISAHRSLPWVWTIIKSREDIPLETKILYGKDVHWYKLWSNETMLTEKTWEAMDANIDAGWPFYVLSKYAPTWLVAKHPHQSWNFLALNTTAITAQEVRSIGFHEFMVWGAIYESNNITAQDAIDLWKEICAKPVQPDDFDEDGDGIILFYPYRPPYKYISSKPSLTEEIIKEHLQESWDWWELTKHMPLETIEANPGWRWSLFVLCSRIDVDTTLIQKLEGFVDWTDEHRRILQNNPYMHTASPREVREFRKHSAARRIQRWWGQIYWNPTSSVCQQRILRDWNVLAKECACPR